MNNCSIKIPVALFEHLKIMAREKGYSSAEEMINHIFEKTVDHASCSAPRPLVVPHGVRQNCSAPRPALRSHPGEEGRGADSSAVSADAESIKHQLKGLGYFNG